MTRLVAWAALAIAGATSACATPPTRAATPPSSTRSAPASFRLTMFDVGSGLSVLVDGEDFRLLYDAGSNDDRAGGPGSRVASYLVDVLGPSGPAGCGGAPEDAPRRVLDHVLLSHPHRDHLSLFPAVFACFGVAHVWDSGFPGETKGYQAFLDDARASGAAIHRPVPLPGTRTTRFAAGTSVTLGRDARFTVLAVDPSARDENAASIVVRLDLGARSVLLMGDAEAGERAAADVPPAKDSVEGRLLAARGRLLDVDVLVVGHHGSASSTRAAFLDRVSPTIALVSAGPMPYGKNGVRLPDDSVLDALRARRTRILRTDVDDDACRDAPSKVGNDADGAPGGCSAVTLHFRSDRIDFEP